MQPRQLGPYRIGKKLGQGGMGAVYESFDDDTNRAVAVKVLSPAVASDPGFRLRFEAEIESLEKLRHPNIVQLFGYGEEDGYLYYAMERVEGGSLEDEIRHGRRFEWREVTQIAIKLCRALKHAHDHGVIHRDIKPANLLLSSDGEIKLSDFGIARLFGNTRMTSDGSVLGTAEYMAPEQADGRPVTDRCDQYSLGGVMYALLAGRPPFRAKSLMEMLQLQRFAEPDPVRRYAPNTPAELERTIAQLLEKDPQKRFANTLMLARSLEAMEHGLSITSNSDEFVVRAAPIGDSHVPGLDPLAATQVPGEPPPPIKPDKTHLRSDATAMTALPSGAGVDTGQSAGASQKTSGARFVKVEIPKRRRRSPVVETIKHVTQAQVALPALGLVLLGLLVWYLAQPESADQMYARVKPAADSGDPSQLLDVDDAIKSFLYRYPDDPRAAALQRLEHENSLTRADNRYRRLARQRSIDASLSPVERDYIEALRMAATDPEKALTRFSDFVTLYDDPNASSEEARRCLELARRQRAALEQQVERQKKEGLAVIESRLAEAEAAKESEPERARQIWQAIVERYREESWASELVSKAEKRLKEATPSK